MKELDFRAVSQSHSALRRVLREGMTAVDATCGNGYDTLFLESLVGEDGKVYAYDISADAVLQTKSLLGAKSSVEVQQADHKHFDQQGFLPDVIHGAILNLGYLPGSDHKQMTQAESTVTAIKAILSRLAPGGMITVVVYPHNVEELQAVEALAEAQTGAFSAFSLKRLNRRNPPYCIFFVRESE